MKVYVVFVAYAYEGLSNLHVAANRKAAARIARKLRKEMVPRIIQDEGSHFVTSTVGWKEIEVEE